jgi:outer membrane biosynthesis protein TonB
LEGYDFPIFDASGRRFVSSQDTLWAFDSGMQIKIESAPTDGQPVDRLTGGLIGSSVLHLVVVLLLVFGLRWLMQSPAQVAQMVPVDLVQLGEKTASPSSPEMAPLPQEMAREILKSEPAEAVPVAQTPPPQAALHQAEERYAPNLPTLKPEPGREFSRPVKGPKPAALPAAKLPRQPLPADDLSTRLKRLAQLRQPESLMPPNPRRQDGSGSSNLTATSADAARARDATYGVKDFIRAQVERRWYLDGGKLKGSDWVVAIHIVLSPDGSVSRAEIVENTRYRSDSAYRDFARSARNAVLLSSPITVPPGNYNIAKDIVLDFNSKQVLQ